jgi:hypothetical protein
VQHNNSFFVLNLLKIIHEQNHTNNPCEQSKRPSPSWTQSRHTSILCTAKKIEKRKLSRHNNHKTPFHCQRSEGVQVFLDSAVDYEHSSTFYPSNR